MDSVPQHRILIQSRKYFWPNFSNGALGFLEGRRQLPWTILGNIVMCLRDRRNPNSQSKNLFFSCIFEEVKLVKLTMTNVFNLSPTWLVLIYLPEVDVYE